MIDTEKQKLRERILTLLRNQREEERLEKSLVIRDKLFQLQEYQNSILIMFYASFDGEVNTFEMISQANKNGKKICLPRIIKEENKIVPTLMECLEKDLEEGPYGIKQPKDNFSRSIEVNSIDMVIVPGVAFDKDNRRLGRGGGYYDRFLKTLPSDVPTVGLAFDFQIVDHLPHQDQDVPVSHVLYN